MKRKRKNDSQKKDETFQGEVFLFTQKKLKRQKKAGGKKEKKKTKREKSKRKTQKGENQEEKRRKTDEKRDTQKRCLKRKREKSPKNAKNTRMNTFFFEKRGHFCAHKKVSAQDKGGEKHFLFFKKKGKVDQKNIFLRNGLSKEHIFSVFFFLVNFFFAQKKTKEEKQKQLMKHVRIE